MKLNEPSSTMVNANEIDVAYFLLLHILRNQMIMNHRSRLIGRHDSVLGGAMQQDVLLYADHIE